MKELQSPCSEAGERAVGLLLDAVAGLVPALARLTEACIMGAVPVKCLP